MKPVLNWVFPGASPRARADSLFSTNSNTRSRKVLPSCAAQVLRRLNSGSGRSRVVRMDTISHKNIFVLNGWRLLVSFQLKVWATEFLVHLFLYIQCTYDKV